MLGKYENIQDIPQPRRVMRDLGNGYLDPRISDLVFVLNGIVGIKETRGSCEGAMDDVLHPYPWVTFFADDEQNSGFNRFVEKIGEFSNSSDIPWKVDQVIMSLETVNRATNLAELRVMQMSASKLAMVLFRDLINNPR